MQSLAAVSKANTADVQPLMSKLDTLLRSLLADFSTDNAGKLQGTQPVGNLVSRSALMSELLHNKSHSDLVLISMMPWDELQSEVLAAS